MAWYDKNSAGKTQPVGGKKANELGIHDLSGNVWERCQDVWHVNYQGAPTDGSGWISGGEHWIRVLRGGSWADGQLYCLAAYRLRYFPADQAPTYGFRLARY